MDKTLDLRELSLLEDALVIARVNRSMIAEWSRELSIADAKEQAQAALKIMRELLGTESLSFAEFVEPDVSVEEFWSLVALVVGSVYDAIIRTLMTGECKGEAIGVPGLSLDTHGELLRETKEVVVRAGKIEEPPLDAIVRGTTGVLFVYYLSCLLRIGFIAEKNLGLPRWGLGGEVERQAHGMLKGTFQVAQEAPNWALKQLGLQYVETLLLLMEEYYNENTVYNKEHPLGPFSAIKLGELDMLARRDPKITARDGDRYLARQYEHQLALILQSYGFHVVSTRPGERSVDLVCISADRNEPLTVMVEAKSTKRAYALPAKDERALKEYVEEVKRTLGALPKLKLVIIIAAESARTLEEKLGRLEIAVGTPVRFARAQSIASLREKLPGGAPLRLFVESLLEGPHVLPDDIGGAAIARFEAEENAYAFLVRTLLGLEGVVRKQ
jgi:hypothetical protein